MIATASACLNEGLCSQGDSDCDDHVTVSLKSSGPLPSGEYVVTIDIGDGELTCAFDGGDPGEFGCDSADGIEVDSPFYLDRNDGTWEAYISVLETPDSVDVEVTYLGESIAQRSATPAYEAYDGCPGPDHDEWGECEGARVVLDL